MNPHQNLQDQTQLFSDMSEDELFSFLKETVKGRVLSLSPPDALKFLFSLDSYLYELAGQMSVAYDNGIHTKHRHTRYHDFFVNRIAQGETILDVGCGIGALAFDIASKSGAIVTGIDINDNNIRIARSRFAHENVKFIHGDALETVFDARFDAIVLSNVLEHIECRVKFLREIMDSVRPDRILLRVPLFERDWRVPLKKELGLDYRLDSTHYIEYTHDEFASEIEEAGLKFSHYESRWGEIWAEARP